MPEIILTQEQSQVVAASLLPIQVKANNGDLLGTISPPWTEEDIDQAKRILVENKKWYTTDEVLAHLRSLGAK